MLAMQLGWRDDMPGLRDDLLAAGLRDDVAVTRAQLDEAEAVRRADREHCGQPDASPACQVQIRYLYQVLRGFPKAQVFGRRRCLGLKELRWTRAWWASTT